MELSGRVIKEVEEYEAKKAPELKCCTDVIGLQSLLASKPPKGWYCPCNLSNTILIANIFRLILKTLVWVLTRTYEVLRNHI